MKDELKVFLELISKCDKNFRVQLSKKMDRLIEAPGAIRVQPEKFTTGDKIYT